MKASEILVPVDVAACPLDVFSFVNEYVKDGIAKVTLLHVSRLNVQVPENRLYMEVAQELEMLLLRLKAIFLSPQINANVCVRAGKPAREIVEQAAATKSDLILLTNDADKRRKGLFKADVVKEVIAAAPCPVCVLQTGTQLDCRRQWSSIEKKPTMADATPLVVRPAWPLLVPS
jgi:nucleotide-binding universal stress UspA family protein